MSAMRGYAFLGTTIAVESDLPATAAWLDEFLIPGFAPWTGDCADFVVHIVSDPGAHAAVAARRPLDPLPAAPCFALDQEVVRHASWRTSNHTVIADERFGAFYILAGNRIDVVADPRSDRFRAGAMRVIRELGTARALASAGRLQLHAAALEVGGRGLLLAGAKRVGKTTLLAYLASSLRADLLTNDRAILRVGHESDGGPVGAEAYGTAVAGVGHRTADARGIVVHGVATIVSVRPGTLALLPWLADGLPTVERLAHLTLAEAAALRPPADGATPAVPLKLSPSQLARQLGVSLTASAELAAIAFPEPEPDPDGLVIEQLTVPDAERRLTAARYGVAARKDEATVFERFAGACRPNAADDAPIAGIATRTRCFVVRIGADRLATPSAAEAVRAAAFDAP